MSAITAKASRKMKKYAVLTREPRCFLGSFDFSWEQRKFDEVFDCTVPNNTLSRAELSYDEGTVLNVHYGDVLIKYGSVLDVQKDDIPRIPHRCRADFNGALLQDGDVIIADTAEDETTGKACEIGNLQGSAIVSGLHTMVCRPRNRMALGYLGYYLNSNAYHHQLLPLMQGIKVLSLSRSNIQKTSVSYPIAVKEQQLIAYYFSQLDNLITLHQRQPFLHSSPEISLTVQLIHPFYTSSWEQRKLGDVVKEITRNDPESEAPIMMITANNGFIEQSERYAFNNAGESLKKYILLKKGELAYNHGASKLRPYGSCFALTTAENARIPFVYHCFSAENQNAEFMSIELNGAEIENQLRKIVSSGARMDGLLNISFDEYTSVSVLLPGTEEQDRIADFFRHLDNLITLHQRKGKAAVTGCSNDANNSKGVYCKARDFGYKC